MIGPPEAERTPEAEAAAAPAKRRRARYVLEDGILEVDGKPRDGLARPSEGDWNRDELKGNVTDLSRGQRCSFCHYRRPLGMAVLLTGGQVMVVGWRRCLGSPTNATSDVPAQYIQCQVCLVIVARHMI